MNKAELAIKQIKRSQGMKIAEKLTSVNEDADSMMDMLITAEQYSVIYSSVGTDKEAESLLDDVLEYFEKKFKISKNEKDALDRILSLTNRKTDSRTARSAIFKAANSMKMKLPSQVF